MTSPNEMPRKLWEHPDPESTNMWRFMQEINKREGLNLKTFQDLYTYSITQRLPFWSHLFTLHPLIHSGTYTRPVDPSARMDATPKWFEGVSLNFAENMLFSPSPSDPSTPCTIGKEDAKVAVTEVREGCTQIRHFTWGQLRARVARLSNAMRARGLRKGDRVAVVSSNSLDTLVVFLATTAAGALFSSSSTDMGSKGVLDRLVQIKPRWVFVDDGAVYNGKTVDLRPKMGEVVTGLEEKGVGEFEGVVSMPRWAEAEDVSDVPRTSTLEQFLRVTNGGEGLSFERIGFGEPFLVVYSSGTTGTPKCIVHSAGGVLINSVKEGRLHRDLGPENVALQYTTTGWIMYLSSVQALHHGARVILYDGSPFQPDLETFIRLVGSQKVTDLGISPRYLQTLSTSLRAPPKSLTDLTHLHRVSSTGMVLSDALFEWVYTAFPPHIHLANISGGTDIAGCFGIENPLTPVYAGGCQGPGLGIAVEVFDQTIETPPGQVVPGKAVAPGEAGELVATQPFPNQPIYFWGDEGGRRFQEAYFARFENVWTHGDFIFIHPLTGGIYFLGRADGVLNPSGVRFGSAEIYSVVEAFFADEVGDSICVGQRRPQDQDETVLLFLLMKPGRVFTETLAKGVRERIGRELGKRYAPKYVFETPEIPTTVNLKKVELPVKQIVSGKRVVPSGTLLNPESLEFYYRFVDVEKLVGVRSKL